MKYKLIVLPEADKDVEDIAFFIAKDSVDAALRFFEAVTNCYAEIQSTPLAWQKIAISHPRLAEVHKRGVKGFRNHMILYQVKVNAVYILRVLHGARDVADVLIRELPQD